MTETPLALVQALLLDTQAMHEALATQASEVVLDANMLQRWLARTERIRQLQDWAQRTPLKALPQAEREAFETTLDALCKAMVPIGPVLERHQQSIGAALAQLPHRRAQLEGYARTGEAVESDRVVAITDFG
jgi:hypothetical protein